jgi:Ca2+-transporting ATPase
VQVQAKRAFMATKERQATAELVHALCPTFGSGLTEVEAARRLLASGRNVLAGKSSRRWSSLAAPLKEPMVWLLLIASLVYYFLGDLLDATITAIAIVPIALIDLVIETRTDNALRRLKELGEPQVTVVRDGRAMTVDPESLVQGDRLSVAEGDVVMADAALIESSVLQVDESSLTGESLPVQKSPQQFYSDSLFENAGTVFAGTKVLSGRAACLVVGTGLATQYGKIGSRLAKTRSPRTRLQNEVSRVVWVFGAIAVVLSVALVPIALFRGDSLSEAFLGAISLAIAAIPEELPVAFTIFLAFGMLDLAKNQALVKRLPAVEALGSINVICTDKTGTLTSGVMKLTEVATDERHEISEFKSKGDGRGFLLHAVMACDVDPFDTMEKAIQEAAADTPAIFELRSWRLMKDYPFDAKRRLATHVWERDGEFRVSSKGSVEAILGRCSIGAGRREEVERMNEEMASEGSRVLAVGSKLTDRFGTMEENESGLAFDGLAGFNDPVREGVREAVREAQEAGVRVVMLTGDQKATAHAIAHRVGLEHEVVVEGPELDRMSEPDFLSTVRACNVFCRVTPEHKLRIVEGLQKDGFNVAVTGDGVNDSPALKKADIGVAMGKRGTEVAKEAASLVLLDDNFKTIVGAIRNGRKIYDNLQKVFGYLVAFHVPIFFAALLVPVIGLPLLLLPIQIVMLELVLHPVVSLVFEGQPAEPGTMKKPPRPKDRPIVDRSSLSRLVALGFVIFVFSFVGYLFGFSLGYGEDHARALGFTAMILCQMAIVPTELGRNRLSASELAQNHRLIWISAVALLTFVLVLYVPGAAGAAKMAPLSLFDWVLVGASAFATYCFAEASKRLWPGAVSPTPR